jgi:multidrug resistance efflux pump
LSYTRILAAFDGRITKKGIEPGNYVEPGQTVFSLVPNEVWVIANFKETQLKQMKVGQPVSIKVAALPDREFRAHIESFQVGTGNVFTLLPPENATGNYVRGPHTKRNFKYGKELCLLVGGSARARHEERWTSTKKQRHWCYYQR